MKRLLQIILVLTLSSCTSIKQNNIETFERGKSEKYPPINLFVNGGQRIDSGCYNATCYSLYNRMPEFVEREFKNSNNFQDVALYGENHPWSVFVDVRKVQSDINGHGDSKFFVSILTLGAVPTTSEHIYAATIKIYSGGNIIKTYSYSSKVKEISSLFVDVQADDSDAVILLMSKFFNEIENENPFR